MMTNGNGYAWWVGSIGLAAGCIYLFATQEGKKLRRRLYRAGEDCKYRMVASSTRLIEDGKDWIDRAFQH